MSLLRAIKTLTALDWEKILGQYSFGALLFEIGLIPFWFFSTGSIYLQVRTLLGCNYYVCYKFAMLISLIPSTLISAKFSALARSYLFPDGYHIIEQEENVVTSVALLENRTLRVYVFAILLGISGISLANKAFPNNKYTYFTRTLRPRTKHKIRNLKFKLKKKFNNIFRKSQS